MRLLKLATLLLLVLASTAVAEPRPGLSLRLVVYQPSGGHARFLLRVENFSGTPQVVTQPTGQSHDFSVVAADGREVWRWSADKFFLQAVQERVFQPGTVESFEGEWSCTDATGKRVPPGRYEVRAWLPVMGGPPLQAASRPLRLEK
ncbi:MAG: BsuPI-related putative proteinase inhibitor [Candidatus Eremiobacterota bacterium]